MAAAIRIVCNGCKKSVEAWNDGNPYYLDEVTGEKRYADHPSEGFHRCIGNDWALSLLGLFWSATL